MHAMVEAELKRSGPDKAKQVLDGLVKAAMERGDEKLAKRLESDAEKLAQPEISMVEVEKSSQVAQIGYDAATRRLAVRFKSGGLYIYCDVPTKVWDGLQAAESKGTYIAKSVKGTYGFVRIPEQPK